MDSPPRPRWPPSGALITLLALLMLAAVALGLMLMRDVLTPTTSRAPTLWRATFYVTGAAHSIVGGSAWEGT